MLVVVKKKEKILLHVRLGWKKLTWGNLWKHFIFLFISSREEKMRVFEFAVSVLELCPQGGIR